LLLCNLSARQKCCGLATRVAVAGIHDRRSASPVGTTLASSRLPAEMRVETSDPTEEY